MKNENNQIYGKYDLDKSDIETLDELKSAHKMLESARRTPEFIRTKLIVEREIFESKIHCGNSSCKVCFSQIVGTRTSQQDVYADVKCHDKRMLLIADGMGGMYCGERAAEIAASVFSEKFAALSDISDVRNFFVAALKCANAQILAEFGLKVSGTTLLAVVLFGGKIIWASVGDSPLMLFRDGVLHCLNRMHVVGMFGVGEFEYGNMLTSSLCGEPIRHIDIPEESFALRKGDILVIASDGIMPIVPSPLSEILSEHTELSEKSEKITALLDSNSEYQDNSTFFLAEI